MQKSVIICLSVKNKYSNEYVYRLRNMVARFCNQQYDFICYTDKVFHDIRTIHISDPDELEPVWFKLRMLDHPLLNDYHRKIFLDLDVVIHNNIDWMFKHPVDQLYVIQPNWKPQHIIDSYLNTGCNSSIMIWRDCRHIAQEFENNKDNFMCRYAGIDRFLWHEVRSKWGFIQSEEIYSYRYGASLSDNEPRIMRKDKGICIYNQYPKPHEELEYEPAKSYWI